ncbi:dinucleotide-utilizing enzyme [Microbacterium lacus]|uniref:dinucleotide-utilizing enzyme n=1 Tax=Microbacterium lacus TaxID=415217 RepID=UPI00384CF05E
MALRPSLVRSIPFWILLAGSLASVIAGALLVVDKIGVMSTALLAGTATGVEVYVGQSWIVVGGALIAAGLIGLVTVLGLAVVRSLMPATPIEVFEPVADADENDDHEVVIDEPVAEESLGEEALVEEPVVEQPVAEPTR